MSNYKGNDRLEQHYTPKVLIDDMFEMLNYYKGEITEFLENSAGDGRLIDELKNRFNLPIIAYDIHKNERTDIKFCNYLKEKVEYKKGRVAFINPPFISGIKFLYKALNECDYCVSVLSPNTIMNIDYKKYYIDRVYMYKKLDFGSCKVDCCIIGIRKNDR